MNSRVEFLIFFPGLRFKGRGRDWKGELGEGRKGRKEGREKGEENGDRPHTSFGLKVVLPSQLVRYRSMNEYRPLSMHITGSDIVRFV